MATLITVSSVKSITLSFLVGLFLSASTLGLAYPIGHAMGERGWSCLPMGMMGLLLIGCSLGTIYALGRLTQLAIQVVRGQ